MTPRPIGNITLRKAVAADRAACYAVCLGTGDSGRDATHLHADPDALGHVYVGAYLAFEPELSLVLEDHAGVCGYALAAIDTKSFHRRYVDEWLPPLRQNRPAPAGPKITWSRDEQLWNLYHHPELFIPEEYEAYPSHLHIDLLSHVQGRGLGRAMMTELLGLLAARGSPGVHLAMASDNHRAAAFYAKLGFTEIARNPDTLFLARSLP